jgi:hypothetical protein
VEQHELGAWVVREIVIEREREREERLPVSKGRELAKEEN